MEHSAEVWHCGFRGRPATTVTAAASATATGQGQGCPQQTAEGGIQGAPLHCTRFLSPTMAASYSPPALSYPLSMFSQLALEVALGSSVISEEQVSCLWEASHPLRAKDVAKIASQALLQQVSQVSEDAPGVADRFGQVLKMLLAGSSVSSAQIRMMVACTHELTSETIHRVMEEKLREAYQKKETLKQVILPYELSGCDITEIKMRQEALL